MCPIPGIIGSVVAVEHGVSGFLQILNSFLGLCHVAAKLLKFLAWHSTLVPALCFGNNRITEGYREIIPGIFVDVIPVGNGKLIQQIAFMHGMYFYAVHSGVTQFFRCFSESFHHLMDLLNRHRAGIDAFSPTVRRSRSGSTAVFNIQERFGQFAERRILQ